MYILRITHGPGNTTCSEDCLAHCAVRSCSELPATLSNLKYLWLKSCVYIYPKHNILQISVQPFMKIQGKGRYCQLLANF